MIRPPKKNIHSAPHSQNNVILLPSLTHPQGLQPPSDQEILRRCSPPLHEHPSSRAHQLTQSPISALMYGLSVAH